MRKICLLLLVTILLFTLSNESYARRRFNEPPDYAYLRGRIAEFRSIFQILGRKSFFDVLGVYEKNFKNPLANTIGKRIEKYGLEKMKSELSLIGPLGKKFLSRIPNQKTEKKRRRKCTFFRLAE